MKIFYAKQEYSDDELAQAVADLRESPEFLVVKSALANYRAEARILPQARDDEPYVFIARPVSPDRVAAATDQLREAIATVYQPKADGPASDAYVVERAVLQTATERLSRLWFPAPRFQDFQNTDVFNVIHDAARDLFLDRVENFEDFYEQQKTTGFYMTPDDFANLKQRLLAFQDQRAKNSPNNDFGMARHTAGQASPENAAPDF